MFKNFKSEYGKTYASVEEEASRFAIFVDNLKLIDARNAKDSTAHHGITKFSDMTVEEFKSIYNNLMYDPDRPRRWDEKTYTLPPGVTASADWSGVLTTPVKNQGVCGSCWAHSAVEQLESDFMREGGNQTILSVQQVTSCTLYYQAGGCNGGFIHRGIEYARKGLETEDDYPYTSGRRGNKGTCSASYDEAVVKSETSLTPPDAGFVNVGKHNDEAEMAAYVATTGPLAIVVDASDWSSYTGGIVTECGTSINHAVQLVGVNEEEGYWKVRNSWGDSWGESGYIRLQYGTNMCGMARDAAYTEVEAA